MGHTVWPAQKMQSPWPRNLELAEMETGGVGPSRHITSTGPAATNYNPAPASHKNAPPSSSSSIPRIKPRSATLHSFSPHSVRPPMRKLYRKGTVHPSPPPVASDQLLAFLPSAIFALVAALSPEEREVLDYLLSCSGGNRKTITQKSGDHPPQFNCNCFRCYMSYWAKWDSSPNRQLIHEIIDAFEDGLVRSKNPKSRKERRRKGCTGSDELKQSSEPSPGKDKLGRSESMAVTSRNGDGGGGGEDCEDVVEGSEKGSVRKFVSFLGERIWGVWTQ